MLRYAMLCLAVAGMLCYAMLCYAMLCYAVRWQACSLSSRRLLTATPTAGPSPDPSLCRVAHRACNDRLCIVHVTTCTSCIVHVTTVRCRPMLPDFSVRHALHLNVSHKIRHLSFGLSPDPSRYALRPMH